MRWPGSIPGGALLLLAAGCASTYRADGDAGPDEEGAADAGKPDAGRDGGGDGGLPGPSCPDELDPAWHPDLDGLPPLFGSDGLPDDVDPDSDGDGVPDEVEESVGTDPCDWDSDDDGVWDPLELAYDALYCRGGTETPTPRGCGCALDSGCLAPEGQPVYVAPREGRTLERWTTWATRIERLDLFLLLDGTGSSIALEIVFRGDIASLYDRLSDDVDVLRVGAGRFEDFPLGFYGSSGGSCMDTPFALIGALRGGEDGIRALDETFRLTLSCGSSAPEAQTEALHQAITGVGGTWTYGESEHTVDAYADECEGDGFGAPCFSHGALPLVVLATDYCSHEEPPGGSGSCPSYAGITPAPTTWEEMIREMTAVGAKVVGLNTRTNLDCTEASAATIAPCHLLRRTAEGTGAVTDGGPVVMNRPVGGRLVEATLDGARRVLTDVRYDVALDVSDDVADPDGVDARDLVRVRPACRWPGDDAPLPDAERPCWTAAPEIEVSDTLRAVDERAFRGVLPGGEVTFAVDVPGVSRGFRVYGLYLGLRMSHAAIGDARRLWIVTLAP